MQFVSSVATQAIFDGEVDWDSAFIDGAFGAVSGMLSATGLGAVATGFINTGLSFANDMITTGISNGWEYSAGEIVGIAASSIVSGIAGGKGKHDDLLKIRRANSLAKKVRGRISSGYYNRKGHAASSIRSATKAANRLTLSVIFEKGFYKDYAYTFLQTSLSGAYQKYIGCLY